jgi:hypothetical protein
MNCIPRIDQIVLVNAFIVFLVMFSSVSIRYIMLGWVNYILQIDQIVLVNTFVVFLVLFSIV